MLDQRSEDVEFLAYSNLKTKILFPDTNFDETSKLSSDIKHKFCSKNLSSDESLIIKELADRIENMIEFEIDGFYIFFFKNDIYKKRI